MAASLTELLELEKLDENLFRSRYHRENFRNTLFGGQVLSQGLMAAACTVADDRLPNSMHAYFLRPGSSATPVIYDVETVRDGNSFSARRAVARQQGRPIFNISASFHIEEEGYHHAEPFPANIPEPEQLASIGHKRSHLRGSDTGPGGLDAFFQFMTVGDDLFAREPRAAKAYFWMKSVETLPDKLLYHYAALAFASDLGLLATALLPHDTTLFEGKVLPASVDHAMWFHTQDFRADEWLLYATVSPWAGGARGFARGSIYTRHGRLVASTAQEGLIRPLK